MDEALATYLHIFLEWNKRHAMVSKSDVGHLMDRHINESLELVPLIEQSTAHLDIGSGGGFPGIPIAIAKPGLRVVLNDRSRNRCRFLRSVKFQLNLDNVEVAECDIRDLDRGKKLFSTATIRGVAPPPKAWKLAFPHLVIGGVALLQSTTVFAEEVFTGGRVLETVRAARAWITPIKRIAGSCTTS